MSHKPQIMVVDDDHAICEFLRMFLDGLGYRSIAVNNAEQAVELYSAERPDAVIMDVIMPGSMDGLGALAAFKKIDREVPVIVISGQGRTATVVQAMKLGAFDFIGKPFDEADLEALLADALRQRRFNRDVSLVRNGLQHPNSHAIARRCRPSCSNRSCSDSSAAPSRVRFSRSRASSSLPTRARSSSMKSAT